jgi:hypothetical protein
MGRLYISTLNIRVMSLNNAQEFAMILLKTRRTPNPDDMGLVEYCENQIDSLIEAYEYIAITKQDENRMIWKGQELQRQDMESYRQYMRQLQGDS